MSSAELFIVISQIEVSSPKTSFTTTCPRKGPDLIRITQLLVSIFHIMKFFCWFFNQHVSILSIGYGVITPILSLVAVYFKMTSVKELMKALFPLTTS